jgi:hypothetical protein
MQQRSKTILCKWPTSQQRCALPFFFFEREKIKKNEGKQKCLLLQTQDQAICQFAGLLANPDVPISLYSLEDLFCVISYH